jgi:hypothetical protein
MPTTVHIKDEIARRGRTLYDERIRHLVEPEQNGRFLALDIDSGEYETDDSSIGAVQRMRARFASPVLYLVRVGYPTAFKVGGPLGTTGR